MASCLVLSLELELSVDELVDVALGTNYARDFDLSLDSIDVHDVAPPTLELSDAKRRASLLSNFLLDNSLYFGANEIISFQKLVGNSNKMTIANLGNTKNLWTPISNLLENICICLDLWVINSYHLQNS